MNQKYVRLNYLLSLSLILFGILYFFASNWQEIGHLYKTVLSVGIMLLFYGSAFVVKKRLHKHPFLSHWLLLAGSLSFGVTVFLLGQIYNWHADSYWLYGIWFVPMVLFAYVTHYQPFYFVSYVLFHLTFWFFMHPSTVYINRSGEQETLLFMCMALINLGIYAFFSNEKRHFPSVKYSALLAFHSILLFLSFVDLTYNGLDTMIAFVYFFILIGWFAYYVKTKNEPIVFSITMSYAALFVFLKLTTWLFRYYGELILLLLLAGVVGLIIGGVYFTNYINNKLANNHQRWAKTLKNGIVSGIIFIASTIGSLALVGLLGLMFDFDEYFIFFLGFIMGVIGYRVRDALPTVKYSLLLSGYLISGFTAFLVHDVFFFLLIIALVYVFIHATHVKLKWLTYVALHLLLFIKCLDYFDHMEWLLLVFSIVNGLMYLYPRNEKSIQFIALLFAYTELLWLTFIDHTFSLYVVYNLLFFIGITAMLHWTKETNQLGIYRLSLTFWFIFVAIKYYDFAWDLIHQSVLCIIIGVGFGYVAHKMDQTYTDTESSFMDHTKRIVAALIMMQCLLVVTVASYQETILRNGQEIKLVLQPLDPRSLLQGDYVKLSYPIHDIEIEEAYRKEKIEVLLRKDAEGVYQYADNYKYQGKWHKPYTPEKGDVVINGRNTGYNGVYYGIENFFIPEGTGRQVEEKANFAIVRVSKHQNAVLVDLVEK